MTDVATLIDFLEFRGAIEALVTELRRRGIVGASCDSPQEGSCLECESLAPTGRYGAVATKNAGKCKSPEEMAESDLSAILKLDPQPTDTPRRCARGSARGRR